VIHYEFHPEARVEYLEAFACFEERQAGLGARFTIEEKEPFRELSRLRPDAAKSKAKFGVALRTRSRTECCIPRKADHVLVLALMHHSRKQGYWRHRLSPRAG
jgi:hypothetical protein